MTARDREMHGILLRLELLANGSTQAWNASGGGQGKPDDKMVAIVARGEKPLHIHYRERYQGAHSDASKDAIIAEAKELADTWTCRPKKAREAADGAADLTLEDLILKDDKGKSPEVIAAARNLYPAHVRRIRKKAGVSTEDGGGLIDAAFVQDKPAAARELRAQGVSTRDIADRLGVSQSAVMNWIRKAAA